MRFFIPTILLVAAIGLFVVYTNPTYQNTKTLAAQNASYDEALTKSAELHKIRDELLAQRNSFSENDVARLQKVLPDNVDVIRLIISINNIALKNGLGLTNVSLGDVAKGKGAGSQAVVSASPVGSVKVGFVVAASYANFISFLRDLEHSLRLVDIDKLEYHPDQSGSGTYQVEVRTYWLH